MAISRSQQTANEDLRSQFGTSMSASDYSSAVGTSFGGVQYHGNPYASGTHSWDPLAGQVAGIKSGFFTALDTELTNYEEALNSKINQLETNPNITQAFKGEKIQQAVSNLILAVKAEAMRYVGAMKAAEKQIIESVVAAYQSQDDTVSTSMNSDTSSLS
jgi:hypothetical protein